jgi:hypothetical protein
VSARGADEAGDAEGRRLDLDDEAEEAEREQHRRHHRVRQEPHDALRPVRRGCPRARLRGRAPRRARPSRRILAGVAEAIASAAVSVSSLPCLDDAVDRDLLVHHRLGDARIEAARSASARISLRMALTIFSGAVCPSPVTGVAAPMTARGACRSRRRTGRSCAPAEKRVHVDERVDRHSVLRTASTMRCAASTRPPGVSMSRMTARRPRPPPRGWCAR